MQKPAASFMAVSFILASAVLGASFGPTPGRPRRAIWYFLLRKPGFTPPGPLIGAAWSVLDILLIVSGYRLLTAPPSKNRGFALAGWVISGIALAAHPFLFFGRKSKVGGLAAATSMIASSATAVIAGAKVDRIASLCGLPLVIWSVFAGLLSEEIVRENGVLAHVRDMRADHPSYRSAFARLGHVLCAHLRRSTPFARPQKRTLYTMRPKAALLPEKDPV